MSDCYLTAIAKESRKFSFQLQGYGNFKQANEGLLKTNSADILGFVIALNSIPSDDTQLLEFIKNCSIITTNKKPFLFLLEDTDYLRKILAKQDLSKFSLNVLEVSEGLTDIFICRNVIGTVLKYNKLPYGGNNETVEVFKNLSPPRLTYTPVISRNIIFCLAEITLFDTVDRTLQNDPHLYILQESDFVLYIMRTWRIHKLSKSHYSVPPHITKLINSTEDPFLFTLYQSLYLELSR